MAFSSNQSFEPRVGTAQLVFGVIYALITLIALCLAFYVTQEGRSPYLHYFMALLFAIMAAKSFIIAARVKKLVREGVYFEAEVDSCEPVRGITVIKGVCDIPDYGLIHIESRLVGESIGREIKAFMVEHKQHKLPALVVGVNTKRPRGMFTVRGDHGHLVVESAMLKGQTKEDLEEAKANNSAFDAATSRAKEQTRAQEEQKQRELEQQAQAQAEEEPQVQSEAPAEATATAPAQEQTQEQAPSVAPRDDERDAAIMDALKAKEQK